MPSYFQIGYEQTDDQDAYLHNMAYIIRALSLQIKLFNDKCGCNCVLHITLKNTAYWSAYDVVMKLNNFS